MIALLSRIEQLLSGFRFRFVLRSNNVKCGSGCRLQPTVRVRATDGGRLWLGDNVSVDRFADITVKYGNIDIGSNVYIGQASVICARDSIIIGSFTQIAEHVTIRDQDHRFGVGLVTSQSGFITAPIIIEDNVWIGAKATITKGVRVGKNSVIGANSVVTKDIPPDVVAAGVPACVVMPITKVTSSD